MRKGFLASATGLKAGAGIILVGLALPACAVRRTTRIQPALVTGAAQETTTTDLVARINAWSEAIRTLTAAVDLEPTTGSVYSGVIKEYHDVKGFILLEKPAMIFITGQAPIIRTKIFDMASDGEEFRVYIAPKQKFIVGKTASHRPAKNALENLRPQHILEALLVPPLDATHEKCFREEAEEGGRRYFVITVLDPTAEGELALSRKVWFDRSDLEITRLQVYGSNGTYDEDVQYAQYQDFQGVRYPTRIELNRPVEDYRLAITIQKATFNQPIAPAKFELKKPEKAQLVDLASARQAEGPHGE